MTGKIFINYRRGDDPGHTGRLFDRLQDSFQPEQLFLDVDNIAPGLDFVRVLNERVAECDIVLAVIGRGWLDARDGVGNRRLEDPDDFVRIEITSALNQGKRVVPVLVGDAPMPRPEDLPEALRPLARRNAVRLTHERFRSDTQGLVKALQQGLEEIESQRQAEIEARRRADAEEERKRQEAEAARRAEEEAHRKKAEQEAEEREAEERRRQNAAAKQRAEDERLFATVKRANTVAAVDAFLAANPATSFADEAQNLKASLLTREDAYRRTSASNDPAVLKSFLATYSRGADVDLVRGRLRALEPQQGLRLALVVTAALAAVAIAGVAYYWLEIKPSLSAPEKTTASAPASVAPSVGTPSSQPPAVAVPVGPPPDQAAWVLLKETTDQAALKRFIAQYPESALVTDAQARIAALDAEEAAKPAPPSPDEVTWRLLNQTTDAVALQRFIAQYPNSALADNAKARIAALEAAQAEKATAPGPDQVTWLLLKDTTDIAALQRFVAQYPDSSLLKDAQARIAALTAAEAAKPVVPTPEQIAWNLVKSTKDSDALLQFIQQFPDSEHIPEAQQHIAALQAELAKTAAATAATTATDSHELTRLLQLELNRVGCFSGSVNGQFDDATKAALRNFTKLASVNVPGEPTPEAIKAVQSINKRICPLQCAAGQHADGERCIANVPPAAPKRAESAETSRPAARAAAAPKGNGKCFSFQGKQFCE